MEHRRNKTKKEENLGIQRAVIGNSMHIFFLFKCFTAVINIFNSWDNGKLKDMEKIWEYKVK